MILVIDNYDSFTYNVVQYLGELGQETAVFRNDKITIAEIERMEPERIVISPGPCTPNEAGISMDVIRSFGEHLPVLGICLGHQCIGQVYGGKVVKAAKVMHGKISEIHHGCAGVFAGLPDTLTATRYHSLVIEPDSLPDCLELTAWAELEGGIVEVMGVRHRTFAVEGVQFHPESILTEYGHELLANFISYVPAGDTA